MRATVKFTSNNAQDKREREREKEVLLTRPLGLGSPGNCLCGGKTPHGERERERSLLTIK